MDVDSQFRLSFRGISRDDLVLLEKWYGMTDYFGYATGFKDFSDIKEKLLAPQNPSRLAFMINNGHAKTVGFVYGEIRNLDANRVLWIHILIIEPFFQHRGLGTCAINKLINYSYMKYGPLTCIAAVSSRNVQGLSFWEKVGFSRSLDMEESLHQFGSSDIAILKRTMK